MTTSSAVRTAWETAVWQHPDLIAITDKVYPYDVLQDSQFDVSALYYGGEVNFFTYQVAREQAPSGTSRQFTQTISVLVSYTLMQTDVAGSTFNLVQDRLETVDDLVVTSLGPTWGGTVQVVRGGTTRGVTSRTVDDRKCWTSSYLYTATKLVNL